LNPTVRPDHDDNRKYFIWYESVCRQAADWAMKEAVYDLIQARWPNCKVSNYTRSTRLCWTWCSATWATRAECC
jgi:hypothetical protein